MLARLLAPHLDDLELPLRLYYRGDVVRHQPLRPGRMREYSQLGAELLGGDRTEADERMLTLFLDLLLQARGGPPAPGNPGVSARIRRRRRAPGRPRHRRRARRALALRRREMAPASWRCGSQAATGGPRAGPVSPMS